MNKNNIGLEVHQEEDILWVGIHRPAKRNAINDALIQGLEETFSQIPDGVKCAIIYGIGEHFSAGLDLSELSDRDAVAGLHHSRMWHKALDRIQFGTVPVIALLHGAVVGGGLEIASACHIRVAEKSAFFALPEGQRGIFVGGGASVRLPKLIGVSRMSDMMLTGRVFRAEEAENIGLVNYVVEESQGKVKALELAKRIASNAGMTNYAITQVLPRIAESSQEQGLITESLIAAIAQDAAEAKQRLQDFLQGRAKKVGE